MRSCIVAVFLSMVLGCGASAPPPTAVEARPRHAAQVDRVVLRNLTVEQGELPDAQRSEIRRAAVDAVAEAMDALTPDEVDGVRVDVQIAELDAQVNSVRARALLTVHSVGPPERTRAILQGAATAPGGTDQDAARAASGAIVSAARGLPAALAALD
ncbi:MAG: hypothetical protein AB8I08_02720 [Sandaracinaceae bacterium]